MSEATAVRCVDLPSDGQHHVPVERQLPIRPGRSGLFPRTWDRDILQDEPVHTLRIVLSKQIGDDPSHRVPHQNHPVKCQCIQKSEDVVPHEFQ